MVRKIGIRVAAVIGAILVVATMLLLWPVCAAPSSDAARSRVIVGARVVDVVAGTIGPPTRVEIRDGVIAAIGPGRDRRACRASTGAVRFSCPVSGTCTSTASRHRRRCTSRSGSQAASPAYAT